MNTTHTNTKTRIHHRTCNLCEAMCGLEITLENDRIVSIKGDKEDPFSKGFICPKAVALQDIYHDVDRLKSPLKRTDNGWEEISWDTAYQLVTDGLKSIRAKYGDDAIGIYQGNPNVHNLGAMLFASDFFRLIKTKNRYSATSVDQLPHHYVSQMMLGHSLMLPVPDIDRTMYFLVIGANPLASNGSLMTAAGMPDRIKAIQARGGKMVVIDPRKTETALKADQHLFIKPATDVYFLGAVVNILIAKLGSSKLASYYKGFDHLKDAFERFTPTMAAALTRIQVADIENVANDIINAKSAVCYGRMGVSVQRHGALCQWMIYLINMISGNFDREGGHMFALPAVDVVMTKPKGTMYSHKRWQSRVRGLQEFGNELPVVALAEEIETPGKGQIKAFLCNAGNPVLSTPNGSKLDSALEKLEFMVSFDIYLNETSRHAHVILPTATGLETSHYDLVFNNLAVRNTAKYSPALFPISKHQKYDWQIFKELTLRFQQPQPFWKNWMYKWRTPERLLNVGLQRGPYKLSLGKLKQHTHGLDLGALKPCIPKRLFTPDKMIDMAPQTLLEGLANVPIAVNSECLILINRRHLRSNNSWMHNSERLVKGPQRCTAMMHPQDAQKLGITSGQMVMVSRNDKSIKVPAELSDDMMPGVVSIPHGWGHSRQGTKWRTAEAHAGVSVNDLTDETAFDPLTGNAALFGLEVQVKPFLEPEYAAN